MSSKGLVLAAFFAAVIAFTPLPSKAQTPPQTEQKQEEQGEYKKPKRAPRGHVHYEGDGHDHSKDKYRNVKPHPDHVPGDERGHVHVGHPHGHEHETFDVEALMAFTAVSRIGDKGDRHIIVSLGGSWGKRDGTYRVLSPTFEYGVNPHERLHVALELWGDYFKIQNVTGLEDQKRWGGGVALEFKVALVQRGHEGPVGLTLILAPHVSNSEEATGEKATHYAMDVKLVSDVELIRDMLLLAVNLNFETAHVKARGAPAWEGESMFGVGAALMMKVTKNFLFGIEASYERAYEGYGLNTFAGRALYVGPTMHFKIDEKSQIVAGWMTQVSGRAVGDSRSLDLENFERHRGRIFYSKHF
jgi:hypothetical protein